MTSEASIQRVEAQWTSLQLSEVPPSANNLFAHGMLGRFKTPAYKAWLTLAGHEINRQKPPRVAGAYALTLRFGRTRKLMAGTGQLSFRTEHLAEGVTLYQGDCREVLPTLGKVDAVVTDPPYGIGEDGGKFRGRLGQNIRVHEKMDWDSAAPDFEIFEMIRACSNEQIIWGGNYFTDKLPPSKGWLYWQKLMGGDFSDGELAWTSRDKALREFTQCPKGQRAVHPTQKPVELMKWCLGFVPNAKTICDPFMGSGTTGVAAVKLGRSFIGVEREPKYFDIACKRISEALKQPDFFVEKPKPAKQEAML